MVRTIAAFFTALLFCTTFWLVTPEAMALDEPGASEVVFEEEEDQSGGPVRPGTFDLTLGLGGFWYNYVEPGVDLGMIPFGDHVVFSLGGYLNVGYCLIGCSLFNFAARMVESEVRVNAWHANAMGRALFHLNAIAEVADLPGIDAYAGMVAGPNYFNVRIDLDEQGATGFRGQGVSLLIGPTAGARYTLSGQSGFFVYGEWRWLLEFGSQEFVVTDGRGEVISYNTLIRRGGRQTAVGIGFRF